MNLYSYRIFFALAFFIILCLAATYSFTLEDAQITYRYALRYSEGFSWGTWNRDEVPIEGFTTPLWMLILSIFGPNLDSIAHASKLIGSFSALCLVYLFFILGIKCQRNEINFLHSNHALKNSFLFTSIFCALSLPISWYATTGMETVTFMLLISASLLGPLIKINLLLYIFINMALVAIRPEGVMFSIASAVYFGYRDKRYLYALVPIAVTLLTVFSHRYLVFQELMPNTYFAKSGDGGLRHLMSGVFYFGSFALSYWYVFLPYLALPYLLKRRLLTFSEDDFYFIGIAGVAMFYLLIAKSGGDNFYAFPHWRHGLVLLPLVAFFSFYTLFKLNLIHSTKVATSICLLNLALPLVAVIPSSQEMLRFYQLDLFGFQHRMLNNPMFIWIKENNRSDITIASSLAGELPLTVDYTHIDILGLNDRVVAHEGSFDPQGPIDSKTNMAYVVGRMPELIEAYFPPECITQVDVDCLLRGRPKLARELLTNPAFVEGYLLIDNAPYEYFNRALFIRKDYYLSYARLNGTEAVDWVSPFYQQ